MKPTIGQYVTVHGQRAIIIKVHPAGTIDVQTKTGKQYRVTGLPFA